MTTRKRNEYLDVGLSSEEDDKSAVESDNQESRTARVNSARSLKRPKLSRPEDEDDDSAPSEEDEDRHGTNREDYTSTSTQTARKPSNTKSAPQPTTPSTDSITTPKPKPNSKPPTPGVLYISRIPPFLRPHTLRTLLTPYTRPPHPLGRIFLTPEPHNTYLARKSSGGNKKHSYTDGWIEFARRRDAKIAAELLNGQIMGGKKRGWYHDDVWCVKYLKGFRWEDLMGDVVREEREREAKMRGELEREGRERRGFLEGVARGKIEKTREGKRVRKEGLVDDVGLEGEGEGKKEKEEEKGKEKDNVIQTERRFRQSAVVNKDGRNGHANSMEHSDDVKRVLGKIF